MQNFIKRTSQSSQSQAICQVGASRGDQKLDLGHAPSAQYPSLTAIIMQESRTVASLPNNWWANI